MVKKKVTGGTKYAIGYRGNYRGNYEGFWLCNFSTFLPKKIKCFLWNEIKMILRILHWYDAEVPRKKTCEIHPTWYRVPLTLEGPRDFVFRYLLQPSCGQSGTVLLRLRLCIVCAAKTAPVYRLSKYFCNNLLIIRSWCQVFRNKSRLHPSYHTIAATVIVFWDKLCHRFLRLLLALGILSTRISCPLGRPRFASAFDSSDFVFRYLLQPSCGQSGTVLLLRLCIVCAATTAPVYRLSKYFCNN